MDKMSLSLENVSDDH